MDFSVRRMRPMLLWCKARWNSNNPCFGTQTCDALVTQSRLTYIHVGQKSSSLASNSITGRKVADFKVAENAGCGTRMILRTGHPRYSSLPKIPTSAGLVRV